MRKGNAGAACFFASLTLPSAKAEGSVNQCVYSCDSRDKLVFGLDVLRLLSIC